MKFKDNEVLFKARKTNQTYQHDLLAPGNVRTHIHTKKN